MGVILSRYYKYKNYNSDYNTNLLQPLNNELNIKIDNLEEKINILEKNTQENIKLLSKDIHHINSIINNFK